jgi:hypothetical protein
VAREHTPLVQRWVLKAWLDDFAHHDEVESDARKAFVKHSLDNGLSFPHREAAATHGAPPGGEEKMRAPTLKLAGSRLAHVSAARCRS